jgi:hypothetical protein
VFGSAPTFTGDIVISEGVVSCGSCFWNTSANIAVTIGDEFSSPSSALRWSFSEKGSLPQASTSFHVTQYGGPVTFSWSKNQTGSTCASNFQLDRDVTFNANFNSGANTFAGVFSGTGGIAFTGTANTRIFVLTGANTYAGGTSIDSVSVKVGGESALGTGDVSVGSTGIITYNAKLESAINDKAKLRVATGAVIDFGSYAVSEKVGALYLDGTMQSSGVWGAIGSGCEHEAAFITGSGVIRVGGPGFCIIIR